MNRWRKWMVVGAALVLLSMNTMAVLAQETPAVNAPQVTEEEPVEPDPPEETEPEPEPEDTQRLPETDPYSYARSDPDTYPSKNPTPTPQKTRRRHRHRLQHLNPHQRLHHRHRPPLPPMRSRIRAPRRKNRPLRRKKARWLVKALRPLPIRFPAPWMCWTKTPVFRGMWKTRTTAVSICWASWHGCALGWGYWSSLSFC